MKTAVICLFFILKLVYGAPVNTISISDSNTRFALELYNKISTIKQGENFIFSPLSINFALALTYLGADGETLKQLKNALHLDNTPEMSVHQSYKNISSLVMETSGKYQLQIANRLFGEQTFSILQKFLDDSKFYYGAELARMDFRYAAEEARKTINDWVAQQTNDKIRDLIPQGVLDENTILVLVNAIYFKGDWKTMFEEKNTLLANFQTDKQTKVKTSLMHIPKSTFNYGYDFELNAQILELPYSGENLVFYVVLPNLSRTSFQQMESSLSLDSLKSWELMPTNVKVWMPKFKLETSLSLGEVLQQLGIKDLFSKKANLTRIEKDGMLYVSHVLHKAFIEVNEKGSEAAAATAVVIKVRTTGTGFKDDTVTFKADHPFVYFIKDKRTDSVLFFGRVVQP